MRRTVMTFVIFKGRNERLMFQKLRDVYPRAFYSRNGGIIVTDNDCGAVDFTGKLEAIRPKLGYNINKSRQAVGLKIIALSLSKEPNNRAVDSPPEVVEMLQCPTPVMAVVDNETLRNQHGENDARDELDVNL